MIRQLHFALAVSVACATAATLHIDSGGGVHSRTTPRYASYNVDSSFNRGFFHTDFGNANLRAAAASLAPATLRFGGSGNDYLTYDVPAGHCSSPAGAAHYRNDSDSFGCLNASHWKQLRGLAEAAGADLLFGLSFDLNAACAAAPNGSYVWSGENAEAMIAAWIAAAGPAAAVWGFELGNELNNRGEGCEGCEGCAHGLRPAQQAAALHALHALLGKHFPDAATRPVIVGPDTGYLNPQAWLNATLGGGGAPGGAPGAGSLLHAATHHVYPGVTRARYNDPAVLDRVLEDIGWYLPTLRELAPQAQVWAGEDGPTGGGESGTCSGTVGDPRNVSVCGLYGSVLWYADDMALRASRGFAQYQRQDVSVRAYSCTHTAAPKLSYLSTARRCTLPASKASHGTDRHPRAACCSVRSLSLHRLLAPRRSSSAGVTHWLASTTTTRRCWHRMRPCHCTLTSG